MGEQNGTVAAKQVLKSFHSLADQNTVITLNLTGVT